MQPRKLASCAVALCVMSSALADPYISTPEPGTKERKSILNALRVPVAKQYHQRPTFTGVDILTGGGWAFVFAAVIDKHGKALVPGSDIEALLHKSRGHWRVLGWGKYDESLSPKWEAKYPQVPERLWFHHRAG